MKKVMFVDDEVQILKSIRRIFSDTGFKLYCVESAQAALAILEEDPMDLLVTDMRMPEMDGLELLEIVRKQYPDTVRIVLSGYTEEKEVLQTLQSNLAKTYIFKPWDNDELIRIIEQNLQVADINLPAELVSYINNLNNLPTIRKRYKNILGAIEAQKDFAEISAEIEKDQTVAAKLLQIANSAYYGTKTASVKNALSCIGISNLEDLVKSMEIMDSLQLTGAGSSVAESIWNHAYCTSRIQQSLHALTPKQKRNHFNATAGLLHKIGIVLMVKYYGSAYISMVGQVLEGNITNILDRERKQYGFTHAELSAYLLKYWNAPAEIVEAATYYATPFEDTENRELVCNIHIAQHYACRYYNVGSFCEFQPETFDFIGIDCDEFEQQYQSELAIER